MIKHDCEIDIDLDYFERCLEYLRIEAEITKMHEQAIEVCVKTMYSALCDGKYETAYKLGKKLEVCGAFSNREEIEECYKICAEHGVVDALIYEMEKHLDTERYEVKPDAFPYLYQLAKAGYTKSFRCLADCYSEGIGCERDSYKAERLFKEGMIFDGDEYCRKIYANLNLEIEEYSGEDPLVIAIKTMVCSINERLNHDCDT